MFAYNCLNKTVHTNSFFTFRCLKIEEHLFFKTIFQNAPKYKMHLVYPWHKLLQENGKLHSLLHILKHKLSKDFSSDITEVLENTSST